MNFININFFFQNWSENTCNSVHYGVQLKQMRKHTSERENEMNAIYEMSTIDRYAHMPKRVVQLQEEIATINYKDYYEIYWNWANDAFGTFRCDPLKGNNARNKRHAMAIIKAAYSSYQQDGVKLKSFEDIVNFAKHMGIRILRCQVKHGDIKYTNIA